MKKILKLILITFLFFPIIILASVNYADGVISANEYISRFSDYQKYIVSDHFPYDFVNNKLVKKSNFKTGGFLSKGEYDISFVNNTSYLSPGIEYWTLTQSAGDLVYVINVLAEEKSSYSKSGVRPTQYVKSDINVVGDGTHGNPWEFVKLLGISFLTDNNVRGLVSLKPCSDGQAKEMIKFSLEPDTTNGGFRGDFYICPKSGYKYFSSTCSSNIRNVGINNQYEVLGINTDNLVCSVSFTFDTRQISLSYCNECGDNQASPSNLYYSDINGFWYTDSNGINRINKLLSTPLRTGYEFQGYVISQGSNDYVIDSDGNFLNLNISGVDKIFPSFNANQYKINLNSNGSTVNGTSEVIATYDSDMPKIDVPSKSYTVTLDPNGGDGSISTVLSEYKLDGFYYGNTKYYTSTGESAKKWDRTDNTTLTAKWEDGNIILETPTRKGYTFTGWYDAREGGNKVGDQSLNYLPTKNITLYAHWEVKNYTVTLNGNGATSTNHSTGVTARYGNAMPNITVPQRIYNITYNLGQLSYTLNDENTKAKYIFRGYELGGIQYYNAAGTSARNWDKTSDATLSAMWDSGCAKLPLLNEPGYTFDGWYNSSGSTKIGNGGECYVATKDITIIPSLTPIEYTLTFNSKGGTCSSSSKKVKYGSHLPNVSCSSRIYKITFDPNGGTVNPTNSTATYNFNGFYYNNTQYITASGTSARVWKNTTDATLDARWSGGTITLPLPTRTGYIFTGWYTAANGGTKIGINGDIYSPTATTTIYAHWTPSVYTVTLDDNGGTSGSEKVTATYNSSMPNGIKKPVKSYTVTYNPNGGSGNITSVVVNDIFNGYYKDGVQYYTSSLSSARNWDIASNATLFADWSKSSVITPSPTYTGYTLKGWYTATSGGTKVVGGGESYSPTANITLYAQWDGNQYPVSLDANGATSLGTTSVTAKYKNDMPSITPPTKTFKITYNCGSAASLTSNYSFQGYYYNGNKYYDSSGKSARKWDVLNAATLTANWTNGGITLPKCEKNGYALEGWYTGSTGGTRLGSAGDVYYPTIGGEIYPRWVKTTNIVTLNPNGGTGGTTSVVATSSEPMPSITKPTKSFTVIFDFNGNGKSSISTTVSSTFNGYYYSTDKQYYNSSGTSARNWDMSSDVTLTAKWTGGTISSVIPSNPTKSGYTFSGWYTEKNYGGTLVSSSYSPTSDITLYARWTANQYKVNYNCNGGVGNMSSSNHVYGLDSNLTSNSCVKSGNKFVTWNTKADGSGTSYSNGATVSTLTSSANGSVTLYAQWNPITYFIQFDANGGTGTMSNMTMVYGVEKNLTSNNFTKSGYNFSSWSGSDGKSYSNGQAVSNLSETDGATVKMTAVWGVKTYKVNYNANGGSGAPDAQTKTHDVTLKLSISVPTRSGFKFLGWSTSSTATSATYTAGGSYTSNSATTLYAVWQEEVIEYKLTFNPTTDTYAGTNNSSSITNGSMVGSAGEVVSAQYGMKAVSNMPTPNPMTGSTITIPTTVPTAVGTDSTGAAWLSWTFKGWTTQDAISGATSKGLKVVTPEYQPGDKIVITKDTTLYAVWYWTYGFGGY